MDSAEQGDPGASRLIDVTRVPLDRLIADGESVLRNSIRRLVAEVARPQEILSAFDNFAGDAPDLPGTPLH